MIIKGLDLTQLFSEFTDFWNHIQTYSLKNIILEEGDQKVQIPSYKISNRDVIYNMMPIANTAV